MGQTLRAIEMSLLVNKGHFINHPRNEGAAAARPSVSIIMPVRNEAEFIERSVGSVLLQNYPHELLEIVIADGASTDDTVSRINRLAEASDIPIKVVQNPKRIAPAALNLAIADARGGIIIRIDGHCEIDPDYVSNCVKHLTEGRAEGVGGPITTIGNGLQAESIAIAMSSTFGVGGSAFRTVNDREMYTDTVAFPGYRRDILEKIGAFNEQLVRNQDDEYNYRIRKHGGRILLSPDIRSKYYSRSSFRSLWRQYFQYGYWKVRVLQLHPAQMNVRQFVPLAFVLSTIGAALLAFVPAVGMWPLIFLSGVYSIANLAASVHSCRNRLSLIPMVAFSFAVLHFSYGLGFLIGLFSFAGDWFRPGSAFAPQAEE